MFQCLYYDRLGTFMAIAFNGLSHYFESFYSTSDSENRFHGMNLPSGYFLSDILPGNFCDQMTKAKFIE